MKEKGIVLEVKKKYCTVLTSGGDFRKVRMSGNFKAGQEIALPDSRPGLYSYVLVAACLAFCIVAAGLWKFWTLPAVAAYVCLDINPSVEMALDRDSIVRSVNPLNEDGKNLVDGLDLKGKGIREAVEDLVGAALDKKYIQPGEENVVMSSVVPSGEANAPVIESMVRESIGAFLQSKNIQAEVAVLDAPPAVREEAGKVGLSTGRYILYLNARERGADVSPGDFKNKSIRVIEKEQRIRISEIEKSPPGRWKGKNREQQVEPPGAAENRGKNGESKKPGARPGWGADKTGGGVKPVNENNQSRPPDRDKGKDGNSGGYSDWKSGGDGQDSRDKNESGYRKGDSGDKQDKGKDMSGDNKSGQGDNETGGDRGGNDNNGHGSSGSAVSGGNGGSGGAGSSDKGSGGESQGNGGSDKGGSSNDKGSGGSDKGGNSGSGSGNGKDKSKD